MQKAALTQTLQTYQPFDADEAQFRTEMLDFLSKYDRFYQRSNLTGHFTGSAWIVSPDRSQVLLIHHKKLDRWLQPGGHADEEDESLWHTARREALEECGLTNLACPQAEIFDLDLHRIPEKGAEPAHWHLDVRYLFVADPRDAIVLNEQEINRTHWVSLTDLAQDAAAGASLTRMAKKCQNLQPMTP